MGGAGRQPGAQGGARGKGYAQRSCAEVLRGGLVQRSCEKICPKALRTDLDLTFFVLFLKRHKVQLSCNAKSCIGDLVLQVQYHIQ